MNSISTACIVPLERAILSKVLDLRFNACNKWPFQPSSSAINRPNNAIFGAKLNAVGRIFTIDYGKKRVGIAVTDPLQMIATRLTTIPGHEFWNFLKDYFAKEEVEKVIVGYPMQMNNQPSEAVLYINPFLNNHKKHQLITIPFIRVSRRTCF